MSEQEKKEGKKKDVELIVKRRSLPTCRSRGNYLEVDWGGGDEIRRVGGVVEEVEWRWGRLS